MVSQKTYKKIMKKENTNPPVSPPSARIAFFPFDTEVILLKKTSSTISDIESSSAKMNPFYQTR